MEEAVGKYTCLKYACRIVCEGDKNNEQRYLNLNEINTYPIYWLFLTF